jgi:hypothetical protein
MPTITLERRNLGRVLPPKRSGKDRRQSRRSGRRREISKPAIRSAGSLGRPSRCKRDALSTDHADKAVDRGPSLIRRNPPYVHTAKGCDGAHPERRVNLRKADSGHSLSRAARGLPAAPNGRREPPCVYRCRSAARQTLPLSAAYHLRVLSGPGISLASEATVRRTKEDGMGRKTR